MVRDGGLEGRDGGVWGASLTLKACRVVRDGTFMVKAWGDRHVHVHVHACAYAYA